MSDFLDLHDDPAVRRVLYLGAILLVAVPFLQGDAGVSAIGFIAAMAVSSTIVDVSPFSTNGALVVANTPEEFGAQIKAEFEVYKKVVDQQKLKLD